ncbi:MAG: sigma-70 family RNA polymerase sigma factor [Saprospiraceae bacterium]|nr:sigma-70 family RNA polymerase sigma factor [Saprospiraceae bacterium]MDW8229627.1 sigma-70 family RNA polymerase sigma factor [Saprospiraceae bacterium]
MEDCTATHLDFTALFTREFAPLADDLFRYAFWLTGDYTRAEDLVQETYLRVWRYIDRYRPGTYAKAWLFRICKNLFVNDYRKNGRQMNIESYEDWIGSPESKNLLAQDPNYAAISEEVMLAINTLPDRTRTMVLLDAQGFSYQEIADIMEIPIGTVRSTLHRARIRLAPLLADYAHEKGYNIGGEDIQLDKRHG